MSGKIRTFTVSAFLPIRPLFTVTAHSKLQLGRRLAEALGVEPSTFADVADALWKGRPVFLTEEGTVILPGRFAAVSYQVL